MREAARSRATRCVLGPAAGPAVASPLMTSMEHRDIGWMCGEPMADYAHVVFEAVDHDEEGER